MKRHVVPAVALLWLIQCGLARADVVTLGAAGDATIYANHPNNSDGAGLAMFAGTDGSGKPLRSLIQFDVSGNVPSGATVTGVALTLHLAMVAGGGGGQADQTPRTITLHTLNEDWGEGTTGSTSTGPSTEGQGFAAHPGDATWADRFYSSTSPVAWNAPGGDFASPESGSATVSQTLNSAYSWASATVLISDVQRWLDDPSSNHGWLLENADETSLRTFRAFWARQATDAALRPALQITYQPAPEPGVMTVLWTVILFLRRRA